ncbi:MAG: DNA repair protein RecO [Mycoplasmatales bacterium]
MSGITAYVLKTTNYQEADLIINLLTETGIKTIYGRGYRKPKSNYHALNNRFIKLLINGIEKNKYFQLTDVKVLNYQLAQKLEFETYEKILQIADLILKGNNQNFEVTFKLFEYTIKEITVENTSQILNVWIIYLLKSEGLILNFENCFKCRTTSNLITFDLDNLSLICTNCRTSQYIFEKKAIINLKLLFDGQLSLIKTMKENKLINQACLYLLEENLGITLIKGVNYE